MERAYRMRNTSRSVMSDHGDYADDYGLVKKWHSGIKRCLSYVPMIARVPGAAAAHRVGVPIELFDLWRLRPSWRTQRPAIPTLHRF
jgi:hypothetical protein